MKFNTTKTDLKQSGIYIITNTVNNKRYVGSAVNFKNRWSNHIYALKKGIHRNALLQRAWNKYDEENFVFDILEVVDKVENQSEFKTLLLLREQHYIDLYNCVTPNGYNINPKADSPLGRTVSMETKSKMRQTRFNKNNKVKEDIFEIALKFLRSQDKFDEDIFKISNNARDLLNLAGYILKRKEFNHFRDYVLKNLADVKLRTTRTIKLRLHNDETYNLSRDCFCCNYYDEDFDYCNYLEVSLPDIDITECPHQNAKYMDEYEKYLLNTFHETNVDKITESYLDGKIY